MKHASLVRIFIYSSLIVYITSQGFCGTFSPLEPRDCTRLNNLAYNCCYITGVLGNRSNGRICVGIPVWMSDLFIQDKIKLLEFLPDFYRMNYNLDTLDCGTKVSTTITQDMLCGTKDIIFHADNNVCYSNGENCCILYYDNLAICVDKNKIAPIEKLINVKEDLICLNKGGFLNFSIIFILVLVSLII